MDYVFEILGGSISAIMPTAYADSQSPSPEPETESETETESESEDGSDDNAVAETNIATLEKGKAPLYQQTSTVSSSYESSEVYYTKATNSKQLDTRDIIEKSLPRAKALEKLLQLLNENTHKAASVLYKTGVIDKNLIMDVLKNHPDTVAYKSLIKHTTMENTSNLRLLIQQEYMSTVSTMTSKALSDGIIDKDSVVDMTPPKSILQTTAKERQIVLIENAIHRLKLSPDGETMFRIFVGDPETRALIDQIRKTSGIDSLTKSSLYRIYNSPRLCICLSNYLNLLKADINSNIPPAVATSSKRLAETYLTHPVKKPKTIAELIPKDAFKKPETKK